MVIEARSGGYRNAIKAAGPSMKSAWNETISIENKLIIGVIIGVLK